MRPRFASLPVLLILFLATTLTMDLHAQIGSLSLTGKVQKLAKSPSCSPKATHEIACTKIYLVAGTGVDLKGAEGKVVDIEGSLALALCPTLVVKKYTGAKYSLKISPFLFGKNRLGDTVLWRQTAPALSIVPFVFGAKPGFLPLLSYGTLQLDPLSLYFHKVDVALLGFTLNLIKIPSDKSLVGAVIRNQGSYVKLGTNGIEVRLLNVDCFTIKAR